MSEKCSVYTVASGDNLTLIARRFGFRNYQTIYDHELNAEFKKPASRSERYLPW